MDNIDRRRFLTRLGSAGLVSLLSSNLQAQNFSDSLPNVSSSLLPMKDASSFLNHIPHPFKQPMQTTNYYGSGDANLDGEINQIDYDLIQSGVSNDLSDIDGNGILSTTSDLNILNEFLNNQIPYLPSSWNELETKEQGKDWLKKMMAIDKTDENTYVPGEFVSGDYARLLHSNFFGIEKETTGEFEKPPRFNIPVYLCAIYPPTGNGHGENAVLMGENPLKFSDWLFIEPQGDTLFDSKHEGDYFKNYWQTDSVLFEIVQYLKTEDWPKPRSSTIVKFNYKDSSNIELIAQHPNLVLERDIKVGVEDDLQIVRDYKLLQNYPNPFNPITTIEYKIAKSDDVKLEIYNMLGQKLETLVDGFQSAGEHQVKWNASKYASGVYFYKLQTGNFTDIKKAVVVK